MAFNDVPFVTFDGLKRRVAETKPYRGTTNKFPLGNRKYKSRNFEWYGNTAKIFYGNRALCIVHEDESVEILENSFWQGQNMLLTEMFHQLYFYSNCNKGGDLVQGHGKEHKVFEGLRVNLADNSVHKDRPYEIKVYSLDREQTKPIRAEAEDHFNMVKAFFLASDDAQIIEAMKDAAATEDPFVQFCRLGEHKRVITRWGTGMKEPREDVFKRIKQHAIDQIYLERKPFKCETLPGGSLIPQGNWGVEIVKLY